MNKLENEYAAFSVGFCYAALFSNGLGNYGTVDMDFNTLNTTAGICRVFFDETYPILDKTGVTFKEMGRMLFRFMNGETTIFNTLDVSDEEQQTLATTASKFKPFKLMVDGGDTVYMF